MEEQRLRRFLFWALILGAICNATYLAMAVALADTDLFIISGINAALMVAFMLARRIAATGRTAAAAAVVALSTQAAIVAVLPVFSFAWPALSLAAILTVAIVLGYVRGSALKTVVLTGFLVGMIASFYGVFAAGGATPPPLVQRTLLLVTNIVVTALIVGVLAQFVQRLQHTVAEIMAAYQAEQAARSRAERLAQQTRRLHDVTSQLSRALPPGEIARIVLEQGSAMADAQTAGIWLLEEDRLLLLHARNYPEAALAAFRQIPLTQKIPVVECVQTRSPVWLTTRAEYAARYPESEARARLYVQNERLAVACIPLQAEGRVIGAMVYAFFRDRTFEDSERALLVALGHHCAHALETVRLLQQERAAREMARAADRRKDEFLALLGHELRNPLAPIATALEVMKLRGAGDKELPIMERQVRHLIGLVDDLLDVSRITRGKIRLEKKRVDLAEAVDDAVEMTAPLIEKKKHRLSVNVPRDDLWVDADPRRLAQVISNLLTNAARYTPAGGAIRVRAGREADLVVVTVEDTGAGIDPTQISALFEPFAQGEQPIDRSGGGLGLGLMLVKSLTELHGGQVVAESDGVGHGSRFSVRLPAAPASFDEATPVWLPPLNGSGRQRVLVVDDNQDAARTLGELLECYGYDVIVAFDGPSALEVAPDFNPSIAILDIGLPVMDGYELCRRLRKVLGKRVRMLALSGYGQDQDRKKSDDAGFSLHLVKPIDATALMAALDGTVN